VKVRFEATLDDFIDVALRTWRRQQATLPLWRRDIVVGALLTGALLYMASGPPPAQRIFIAVIGLPFGAFAYPAFRGFTLRRNANRLYREWLGGSATAPVEIEPRAQGLWVAQNGAEMLFPWRDVAGVEDSAQDVEISLQYEGVIVVRGRSFPDAADRSAFLAEVRNRLAVRANPN
jgi:hypothetical protein